MAKITNSKDTKDKSTKDVKKVTKKVTASVDKAVKKVKTESEKIKKAPSSSKKAKATIASTTKKAKKESLLEKSTKKLTKDVILDVTDNISKIADDVKGFNEEIINIASTPIKSTKKKAAESFEKVATSKTYSNIETDITLENGKFIVKEKAIDTLKNFNIVEYYDLPYKYNKTVVKILAQTPTTLFVYWEISDEDRNKLLQENGNDFFNRTKPVLVVTNDSKYYSFEVEINDFANSWYINLPEANCKYSVELARKSCDYNYSHNNDPVAVSYSNEIEMPNDKILYEDALNSLCYIPDGIYNSNNCNVNKSLVYFKNIKTDTVVSKEFNTLTTKTIYDIYNLYQKMYGKDFLSTLSSSKLNLPSSGAISSFK